MTALQVSLKRRDIVLSWQLLRPFTLIAPAVGFVSAALIGLGAAGRTPGVAEMWLLLLGGLLASSLNAASNVLNQIFDLPIDRINKPERPLPAGHLTVQTAWRQTVLYYVVANALAFLISGPTFLIVSCATALTIVYSVPPFRTKRWWLAANLTIAAARGTLLTVAGWSVFAPVDRLEPWFLGLVIGLFIFGAATTKDYADIEGDRANGCKTLPVQLGVRRSAYVIAPFFIIPFVLLAVGVFCGWLVCTDVRQLFLLSGTLSLWGALTVGLILRDPEALGKGNHPSWHSMYLMMMATYLGLVVVYL